VIITGRTAKLYIDDQLIGEFKAEEIRVKLTGDDVHIHQQGPATIRCPQCDKEHMSGTHAHITLQMEKCPDKIILSGEDYEQVETIVHGPAPEVTLQKLRRFNQLNTAIAVSGGTPEASGGTMIPEDKKIKLDINKLEVTPLFDEQEGE
jgi:hypothetical protein